jgi:hemolysin activation/secretion protein
METFGGGSSRRAVAAGIAMALLVAIAPLAARAQTAPPASPPPPPRTPAVVPQPGELAPPIVTPDSSANVPRPAPPRELAKPEDDLRLDVARYALDPGAPAALRDALPRITARYTGANRSFEDVSGAAAEVTRFLQRDLGYYLGYAYIPEQQPEGGVIRIAVLEGRLDRVTLEWPGNLPVKREVVEAYLARLVPGEVLKVRDVERVVYLVNDLRGMTARFEVRAGSSPGTATLVVTPAPEAVYAGKVELDANGTSALGEYRLSGLGQMNSPLGRGDGLTANALVSHTGGLAFALLGYTTPLGNDGIKVGSSVSLVRYQLDKDAFPLDLNGTAATLNAYALYPVVRSRNWNLFTLASLEHKQYEDRNISSAVKKSVDTIALGTTGDFRDSLLGGGVNTYEASVVHGSVRYPAGRNSALDDDERFTKLTYGYTRLQDWITGRALVYFAIRGQYAANNLDTTEQFRIGGPENVRAFPVGEGTGDIGVISSLELRLLPPEAWIGRIAREMVASAFVDAGYVQFRYRRSLTIDPNAGPNHARYAGVGLGLSWVRPGGYTLRVSVAKPVTGTARGEDQQRDARFWLQAAKLFN